MDKASQYRIAHAAGWDAGNRHMTEAGRKTWNRSDRNEAARAMNRILDSSCWACQSPDTTGRIRRCSEHKA